MIDDGADRRWPGDESVLVVVPAVVVEVADEGELAGVTFPNQILPENIRDIDLLLARIELVQVGISILLAHIERGEIVLPAVIIVVPKNSDAEIGVVENKSAEVTHKRLHPDAHRNEVVIVRKIAEVNFRERFLQRPKFLFARRAFLRIRVHDVVFFDVDVVVIVNAEKTQRPIDWLKRGLALEKIDTDREIVRPKLLITQSEKFRAVRTCRAHAARSGEFARFVLEKIFGCDVEKNVLTDDWRITFELAL